MAEEVGEELGRRGLGIICGGQDGIMEAACRGCKRTGGVTIGVMKGRGEDANRYVDFVIPTMMDLARSTIVIWTSSAIVGFEGKFGTLSEIGLIFDIGKPLVFVGEHQLLNFKMLGSVGNFIHYKDTSVGCSTIVDRVLHMIEAKV